ncbi:2f7c0ecf-b374-4759-8059-68b0e9150625 [Thermothielavioides terrestris]|jgi:hypothetical protein|uniref:2f7c0ecf-b374-4759-8059-68b0e9150625 n=1 Tax=Thermothielavioides terrestris TaxID=2587410 RepID=A0A3S4BQ57_9PEZI|nr:2f7c0ecf-b374-4759-8059-68b0e9150625 [Thermothielavioides terrestris]
MKIAVNGYGCTVDQGWKGWETMNLRGCRVKHKSRLAREVFAAGNVYMPDERRKVLSEMFLQFIHTGECGLYRLRLVTKSAFAYHRD